MTRPRVQPAFTNSELEEEDDYYVNDDIGDPSWHPPVTEPSSQSQSSFSPSTDQAVTQPLEGAPVIRRNSRTTRPPQRLIDELQRAMQ